MLLRIFALGANSNTNALSNPEMAVDYILFKESEEDPNYNEIDVMTIAQVVFKNSDNQFFIVQSYHYVRY